MRTSGWVQTQFGLLTVRVLGAPFKLFERDAEEPPWGSQAGILIYQRCPVFTHQVGTCMCLCMWFPPMRVVNQPLGMNTTYMYWSPLPIEKQPRCSVVPTRHTQPIGIHHSTCSWRHDPSGTRTAGTASSTASSYTV